MDAEPTGQTIDGIPWEEPRPPHLPDTLTRVSRWVLPFVLLAAVQVNAAWLDWAVHGDLRDPNAVEGILGQWLPGVCASLLGAALFYRHPDAHRRLPMLVVGVVLLNVTALLRLGSEPLNRALGDATPMSDDGLGFLFFWSGIYGAVITVVGIFAALYIARGLASARRIADVVSGRALGIALVALVAVASVVTLAPYITLPDPSRAEVLTPVNVVNLILSKIDALAWAYLLVIAFGGWLAGERPRIGWLLVALAAIIDVIVMLVSAVIGFVDLSGVGFPLLLLTWLAIARWVFLLAAFALGLPATEGVTVTDDPPAATRSGSGAG